MLACVNTQAVGFGFEQLSDNAGLDISSQLSVDVTDGGGEVVFSFSNLGPISSSIGQIYWDDAPAGVGNGDGSLGMISQISSSDWTAYSGIPIFPEGWDATPPFSSLGDPVQYATANWPWPENGVGASESLDIAFTYKSGGIADVLADITSGALRIGLRVFSIDNEGEIRPFDGYISVDGNSGTVITSVPDGGATMILLGMGLVILTLGGYRNLKRSHS